MLVLMRGGVVLIARSRKFANLTRIFVARYEIHFEKIEQMLHYIVTLGREEWEYTRRYSRVRNQSSTVVSIVVN